MKKIIILIVCLLLAGCSTVNEDNIYNDLDNLLDNNNFNYGNRVNYASTYYSYYLPSDMQEFETNSNASIIVYNNSKAIINLNATSIIRNVDYEDSTYNNDGFLKEELLDYVREGEFTKDDGSVSKYLLKVYKNDNQYLIYLVCDDVFYYGTCGANELVQFVRHLFIVSKSIVIYKDKVLNDYSSKNIIESERKQFDLFEYDIPTSGFLSDLVNQSGGNVEIEEEIIPQEINEEEDEDVEEISQEDQEEDEEA